MNATALAPAPAPAPASVTTPLLYGYGYGSTAAAAPPESGAPDRKPGRLSPPLPAPHTAAALAVNRAQRIAIAVLAALHIARGIILLAFPALGLGLPGLVDLPPPLSGASGSGGEGASLVLLVSGLLGVRDVLLGGLLATADRRSDREVRRALAVNLLSDAADTFVLIFAAACWRQHRRSPVAEIGAVATLAIVEHVTLWTMAADHEGGASEDKKLRLDMWFADMRRDEEMRRSCSPAKLPQ
ncbi:hypothetical protein HRG_008192 [Hirsutella rhossiliensis]|uniref:Uncharacterized protein n=1 Tax=Hirsutella rhossiliensis TaxID=111463 RepID=A0A9P8SGE3_9HYPO|nr:uncharacterized protein HRG_08192 [Hirsutella rhossiliensis]KAH0961039.1 hypothetical protein HRG_08192 [Hirsutella rhossiliensis]